MPEVENPYIFNFNFKQMYLSVCPFRSEQFWPIFLKPYMEFNIDKEWLVSQMGEVRQTVTKLRPVTDFESQFIRLCSLTNPGRFARGSFRPGSFQPCFRGGSIRPY